MIARRVVLATAPQDAIRGQTGAIGVRWPGGPAELEAALALVAQARAGGSAPIGLVAEVPPSAADVAAARAAGASELVLHAYGARREVHEWHTQVPGSFDAVIAAMRAARHHGLSVGVATPLTRSNARVLGELASLLKASGVAMWAIVATRAEGEGFTATVPRIGLGVPAALAALERAGRVGLDARIVGVPSCALGPFASHALPSAARAYGARCAGCAVRASCPGVDRAYLDRFGEAELRAQEAPTPRKSAPALASLLASLRLGPAHYSPI